MWVQSLGRENPLEQELATHSSILAWKIPWTEEPGGLYSMGVAKSRTMGEKVRKFVTSMNLEVCVLSCIQLFVTPWTVGVHGPHGHQAAPSMGFSKQKYWSGLPVPAPGELPNSGIEPTSLESPALLEDSLPTGPLYTWDSYY